MMTTDLIDQFARTASEAVAAGFLQSLVLLFLILFSMRLLKNRLNAAARYLVWYVFLISTVCLPCISAYLGDEGQSLPDGIIKSESQSIAETSPISRIQADAAVNVEPFAVAASVHDDNMSEISGSKQNSYFITLTLPEIVQAKCIYILFCFWILISSRKILRIFLSYLSLQKIKRKCAFLAEQYQTRLKNYADEMNVRRSVRLAVSNDVAAPIVAGFRNVMILVPERLFRQLSDAEFEQVILHELAHVRRCDDWTKLVQKFIEAVFFFHPAVYWAGLRLDIEREVACDNWVVSITGNRRNYAKCLTALVESFTNINALSLTPKMFSDPPQIIQRVKLVLDKKCNSTPGLSQAGAAAVIATMTGIIFCCALIFPAVKVAAFAKDNSDIQPSIETFEKKPIIEQDFKLPSIQVTEEKPSVRLIQNSKTFDLPVTDDNNNTEIKEVKKTDESENRQSKIATSANDNLASAERKDGIEIRQSDVSAPSAEDLKYAAQLDELMRPNLRVIEQKVFSEMQPEIREIETEAYRLSNLPKDEKQSKENALADERLKQRIKDFQKRASEKMNPQVRQIEAEAKLILAQKNAGIQK